MKKLAFFTDGEIKKSAKNGYIMIFTLLVIAASMVIVAYVGHRGSVHAPFMHMSIAREKAKFIALSGIQVAIAQLAKSPAPEQKKEAPVQAEASAAKEKGKESSSTKSSGQDSENKDFLQRIVPTLNRWQNFELKDDVDGIDAQLSVCLMCEEGKINLNRVYNFKKEQFRGDKEKGWKAIMQELCKNIEKTAKMADLFPVFEKTFKERRSKYNDATELLLKKEFYGFKDLLFYEPPMGEQEKKDKKQQNIYLTDIFTVWSSSGKIEPWLFSNSLAILFGLSQVELQDSKKRTEQVGEWLKNFKQKANWQEDWKTILQPMYGKELRTLPKNIDSVLSDTFDPHFFSVRVHAQVGEVTQRAYAILERNKRSQGNNVEYDITLKKLYWL